MSDVSSVPTAPTTDPAAEKEIKKAVLLLTWRQEDMATPKRIAVERQIESLPDSVKATAQARLTGGPSEEQRQAERQAKLDKKLKDHADRVADQTSEYDQNPQRTGTLYVAPQEFGIKDGAKSTTSAEYAAHVKAEGGSGEHYMAGLTLDEQGYKDRMAFESTEESTGGHSGGFFESKYTPEQRKNFDPATSGGKDITGKGTDQVFHPGRHNPHQSDFNLEHRLTDGVIADGGLGATTDVSSKWVSDAVAMEAMNLAKAKAAAELAANPAKYQKSGKFYKNYSVIVDLKKPTGTGVAGTGGSTGEARTVFGDRSAFDPAKTAGQGAGLDATAAAKAAQAAVDSFGGIDKAANDAVDAARAALAAATPPTTLSKKNATKKAEEAGIAHIKAAVMAGAGVNDAIAELVAKAAYKGTITVFEDSEIAPASGFTGTKTGITLTSINADGTGAVFEDGAGQHYPAKDLEAEFKMVNYGTDVMP